MKHPVSRDEVHTQRALRQREQKRAAALEREEEIAPLAEAVRGARQRRMAREEFERKTRIPDCGGCAG